MKNLISNNCVGARLYNINNIKIINPFCWSGLDIDNFCLLYENYDNIDMNNIKIELEYCNKSWSENKASPYVILDDKVIVHFRHYLQNNDINENIITTVNIKSNDIINYCKEKWLLRYERGKLIKPIFFYTLNYDKHDDKESIKIYIEKIQKLLSLKGNHKLYILAHKSIKNICNLKSNNNLIEIIWMNDNELICKNDILLGKNINKYINIKE